MVIPAAVREKLRAADGKAAEVGVQLATQFLREAKAMVAGAYLMPPFKRYDIIPQILQAL
jgi:hypothetical protein